MEPNTAQNPYLPLPSHEPQICYAPPGESIQELEPAKYPSFDQPQPHQQPQFAPPVYPEIELKSQHLNAICPVHTYPLDTVCRALDCEKRLLCCQCAVEHRNNFSGHEETFGPLQELLDDAIIAELDNLAQEDNVVHEEQISVEVADEKGERNSLQKGNSPIENLKMQMSKMMGQVQKEAGKMGDWFTEKQNILGPDNLRREYLEKKRRFLEARPGCQTMELAQLVEVVNKIKRKQCKFENKMQKAWEGQKSKLNKFVTKLQEKSVKLQEKGQKNIDKKKKIVEKFCKKLGF